MNKAKMFYTIVKVLYGGVIRPALVKAVDDPDSEMDEFVIGLLDKLLDHV